MKPVRLSAFFAVVCCLVILSGVQVRVTVAQVIPAAVPLVDEGSYDIRNYLLLGSDTTNPQNSGRTDVLLIVSINRTAGTVAMLSLPRDLWVYVPGWQMQRINTAYAFGEQEEDGGGPQKIIDTIRYNLGLQIDHYARVDFNEFKALIDMLGGIQLTVDCTIQDWRLIDPSFDPALEESWEMFTLPVGIHAMDGSLALWYARSRKTSSDFDRGRRQQALMRGIWHRVLDLGLLPQLADFWPQLTEMVETDIELQEMIDLVPLALTIDPGHMASYTLRQNLEVDNWVTQEGAAVLLPRPNSVAALMGRFLEPPTEHQLVQEQPQVEIVNATGIRGLDRVAADRLALEGFMPRLAEPSAYQYATQLYDLSGQTKGSSLETLRAILRLTEADVVIQPEAERSVDFRIILGASYRSCTYNVIQARPNN